MLFSYQMRCDFKHRKGCVGCKTTSHRVTLVLNIIVEFKKLNTEKFR